MCQNAINILCYKTCIFFYVKVVHSVKRNKKRKKIEQPIHFNEFNILIETEKKKLDIKHLLYIQVFENSLVLFFIAKLYQTQSFSTDTYFCKENISPFFPLPV